MLFACCNECSTIKLLVILAYIFITAKKTLHCTLVFSTWIALTPEEIFIFLQLDTMSKHLSVSSVSSTVHNRVPDLHITSFTCSGVPSYKVCCTAMWTALTRQEKKSHHSFLNRVEMSKVTLHFFPRLITSSHPCCFFSLSLTLSLFL